MEPLIVLVVVTLVIFALGAAGVKRLRSWPVALRGGVAAMFVLTGTVHFVWMREELIGMVPSSLPYPGLIVTITGLLELAGAIGLLWRPTAPWAAAGLSLLLICMFPANVHYALSGLATKPLDALIPRTLMQIVFLSATLAIMIFYFRHRSVRRT
ncbi:MAG: DoxX family protein [Paenibacillus macerans]|uniref:DoxX-like family protein n=1 Tax=Paenibacillus macerans TaxID=44252 RepID=A0A090Y6X1_PAEMA|nr:DoxX family protein [Paenibacillus macerans]KFM94513.1 doxX-like family protein [Paenibacillus macerans]MBS5909573.1 DoxX family protein [Paenibacillus macerans]MCY7557240.1 DoxX family protein [Paenibacillus macerans]MDU5947161.1 DoxX family protein [Paenibacillus macerans]MDU7471838.1 DoxX family protein [Paenibacillus macerans]